LHVCETGLEAEFGEVGVGFKDADKGLLLKEWA
jgi:hypothetical protein